MPRSWPITRSIGVLVHRQRGAIDRIACLLGVDRSTVAHWFGEGERSYPMPVDALPVVIDVLDSSDPARLTLSEVDLEVTPRSRPTRSPMPVQDGVWALLEHVGTVGAEVRRAVADGNVDDAEALRIRSALVSSRDAIDAMLARLPR